MQEDPQELQRQFYTRTANEYDGVHCREKSEHNLSLGLLVAFMRFYGQRSVLDVGCGTGRALVELLSSGFESVGIEPVEALRAVAVGKGISASRVLAGVGEKLPFADGSFDVVCEFGVLHHVPTPALVIREMFRVARHGVFISDSNRFGHGGSLTRRAKLVLWRLGLWSTANLVNTRGRGYSIGGDGVAYSFSVFDHRRLLRQFSEEIHTVNHKGCCLPFSIVDSSHLAVYCVKRR